MAQHVVFRSFPLSLARESMLFRLGSRVRSVAVKKSLTNGRIWTRREEAMHNLDRFTLPPDLSEWSAGKMSVGWLESAKGGGDARIAKEPG